VRSRPQRQRRPVEIVVAQETIQVPVRESPRARAVRIVAGPRRPLEAVVPPRVTGREVAAILERNRGWIERQLAARRAVELQAASRSLARSGCVWIAGEPLAVERRGGGRPLATLVHDRLVVSGPPEQAAAAVERWYRREARRAIGEIAGVEAARLGVRFRSVVIRDQRTRWGSCSRAGVLSFSWRLLLAPRGVLEYVVVHELCHLLVPDHSKAFWRAVEQARPAWRDEAGWLRRNGAELHAYAP
jgi:predicted metal-dependent hydrolase